MKRSILLAAMMFAAVLTSCPLAAAVELIATSFYNDKVYHIDTHGHKTPLDAGLGFQVRPNGIAVDAAGTVYVAQLGGNDSIRRILPNGQGSSVFYGFDSLYDNPEGIAFGPDGDLYVAGTIDSPDVYKPNAVYRIMPDGQGGPFAFAGVQENLGIAVDHQGNVFVTDMGIEGEDWWGEVWRITPAGQSSRLARFQARPFDVAIAPDGETLLVADEVYNRILTVSQAGEVGLYANVPSPLSLAVDYQDDSVYVGSYTSITRILSDGTQSIFATGFDNVRGLAVYASVPEPATLMLLLIGVAHFCLKGHRRVD